jgi:ATP-dependent helicase/DNAse subunit B
MAEVRLLCGPPRSARAQKLDALLREHWGRGRLLLPTRQYAARRIEQIILEGDFEGAWGRPVLTLDDFAADLVRAEGKDPVRLRDFERRLLLERALARLEDTGALRALGPAAATAGFRSHMLRVITQLKQAAVEPEEFRRRVATRPHPAPLDAIVAEVYAEYQAALLEAGVYDLPGLFWEADLVARQHRPAILSEVDVLMLDAFDDFTPSEFRLLVSLATHLDRIVFGMNYDPDPDRADLYAATARTANQIATRFNVSPEVFEEEPPRSFSEFAARHIFWRDKPSLPPALEPDLELSACPDFLQEIETIGRRVKSLLIDDGVPADEIAVVFRNLRDVAGPLRRVFGEFGIPARILEEPSLWESAIGGFVTRLLDALHDWPRDAVADVLASPWFAPPEPAVDAFAFLARFAQIISGADAWRARLANLASRLEAGTGEDIERLVRQMPHAQHALALLAARIDALENLGRLLPRRATPAAFAAALDRILDELRIERAVEDHPAARVRDAEREAMAALRDLLGDWQAGAGHGFDAAPQSRTEFAAALRQALQETPFRPVQPRHGVACLDAESVRHLRVDYVFLGGANEGAVPQLPSSNAIYSDEDIESLAEAGIHIEGSRTHGEREALLFHHALNVARKRVCITWHKLSRRGQEQYPSPYIVDLMDLLPGAVRDSAVAAPAFVPDIAEAASWRDIQNLAFSKAPELLERFPKQLHALRHGAEIERRRHATAPFDNYDGVLADPGVTGFLRETFGVQHLFSVDQIETYRACPFRFFLERVLDIEDIEIPVAEFDARVRGTILHAALQSFHEQYRGRSISELPEDEALAAMREIVEREFQLKKWWSTNVPPGVEQVELRRLIAVLTRYLHIERERADLEWKPENFEVAFGRVRGESHDPLTRSDPFALTTPAGAVLFAGRIDRIDRSSGGARIIDYKSGALATVSDIREGRSLQLPVYALALEEFLLPGVACREAQFQQVGREKSVEALQRDKSPEKWPALEALVRETVAACVAGIRDGKFPPTPATDVCAYCAARRVCRYEPGRIERKEAHA